MHGGAFREPCIAQKSVKISYVYGLVSRSDVVDKGLSVMSFGGFGGLSKEPPDRSCAI